MKWSLMLLATLAILSSGCQQSIGMRGIGYSDPAIGETEFNQAVDSEQHEPQETAELPSYGFQESTANQQSHGGTSVQPAGFNENPQNGYNNFGSPQQNQNRYPNQNPNQNQKQGNVVYRAQDGGNGSTPTTTFQQPQNTYPAGFQQPGTFIDSTQTQGQGSPQVGGPNDISPLINPNPQAGALGGYPQNYADLDVFLEEGQTGRIMIGGAFNSDNGLTGNIIIDEKNFDITRWPTNFREIIDGEAWRGAGQNFRMELVPGSDVQRYLVSFTEPYLFNTRVSFSASGYYYVRQYFDWDEQRLGGRLSLGYRLNHDLSVSVGTKLENVKIYNPRLNTSPQLNGNLGSHEMYTGFVSLTHDTRDHPFMATEGAYMDLRYQQAFGDFDYSRADIDYRRYFLMYQRPDSSGRHTINVGTRLGFTGGQTPVFENYFAGGFSTMRGFDFRGASPIEGGVRVGGEFQWLNTVEYMFPITADDMIKGVAFVDYGTIEEKIALNSENFRIAPGFGFRIHMPAAGMGGAPLAFDFAFPISEAAGDDKQVFTFYLGVLR